MAEFDELFLSARLEGIDDRFDKGTCLMDVSLTLGQQNMSSTCSITIADPEGAIANKLISHSLSSGGIPILRDPSQNKTQASDSQGSSVGNNATGGSRVADTSLSPSRAAFLDVIAYCEGTAGETGYRTMFGGSLFKSYKDHPDLTGELVYGGRSNASGRYQFMAIDPATWENCKKILNLPDFSPISQDKAAIYLVQGRGALGDVDAGRIESAIIKCRDEWTSLPGASQNYGKTMPECLNYYNQRLAIYQGGNITPAQKSTPSTANKKQEKQEKASTLDLDIIKGNRLVVQWADYLFEFFHQSTDYNFLEGKTILGGVGIRWVINRRPRNKTFQKQTFKAIAQQVADNQGLKLDYQATYDVYYEYVSQDGISDYQLLKREAERAGLVLSEQGKTLVVKSLQNLQDTAIVLEFQSNVISLVTKDKAVDASSGDFGTWTPQTVGSKIDIDAITGKMVQTKADIDPTKSKDVTGQSAKQPTGKLQPGTEQSVDKAQAKYKRVRGLPTTVVIPLSEQSLGMQPMQAIRTRGFSPFLNRIWVVDTVSHSYGDATTTLQLYTAVSVKDESPLSGSLPAGNVPSLNGWQYPVHGFPITSLMGMRTNPVTGVYRLHAGTDIGCPTGTPVEAAADGTVSLASYQEGYGNIVRVQHDQGYSTGYAHNSEMKVRIGQTVKRGEIIAISGSTGVGTGAHCHWEIKKGEANLRPEDIGLMKAAKDAITP